MERTIQRLVATTAAWTTLLGMPYIIVFVRLISPEIPWDILLKTVIFAIFMVAVFIIIHVYLVRRYFQTPLGDYFDRDGGDDPVVARNALSAAINLPLIGLYPAPAWLVGHIIIALFISFFSPLPFVPMAKVVGIGGFTGCIMAGLQSFWLRRKLEPVISTIINAHPDLLTDRTRIGYPISLKATIVATISVILFSSLLASLWANRALMSSAVMETAARFLKEDIASARDKVESSIKGSDQELTRGDVDFLRRNEDYAILDTLNCNFPLDKGRGSFPEISCKSVRAHRRPIGEDIWFEESLVTDSLLIFTRLPVEGWFLIRFVDWTGYTGIISESTLPSYLVLLYILALAGLLGYLMADNLITPISSLKATTDRISSGDLSTGVQTYSESELGDLAAGMSLMAGGLKTMINNVHHIVDHLEKAQKNVSGIADRVKNGAGKQLEASGSSVKSIESINSITGGIEENLAELSANSDEVSSSVFEMESTLNSISQSIDDLMGSVSETSSSISQMASSIKQVADNSSELSRIATDTAGAMLEMDASIKTIEENARQTSDYSQAVNESAEEGVEAVEKTIGGIKEIQTTVDDVYDIINTLQGRTDEVAKIIGVIENITKRTNLLSLNASIIAAGAGEHGKGFAVVAEEIRDLAYKTASSTKEIAAVIYSNTRDTATAVDVIESGRTKVAEGLIKAQNAGEELIIIRDKAKDSKEKVENIARAATEHVKSSRMLTSAIDSLAEMTGQISKATGSLSSAIDQIRHVSENIRDRTSNVNNSSKEQAKGFAMISRSVESITEKIKVIYESTRELTAGAATVFETIIHIRDIASSNHDGAEKMEAEVVNMDNLSSQLEERLRMFKTEDEQGDGWED